MECQECHERPATLHFTKIVNGEKTEIHLCEKCAQEKGEMFQGGDAFSINHLLSGILNFEQPVSGKTAHTTPFQEEARCEKCGLTYHEFTRIGRFGCSNCYHTFNDKLDPILKRVHSGNTLHAGKIPKRIGGTLHLKKEIDALKQQLRDFVQREEFEKAAEIRDKIRSLEKRMADQREGGE